jgi:hypothetical protein
MSHVYGIIHRSSQIQTQSQPLTRLENLRWQLQDEILWLLDDKKKENKLKMTKSFYNEVMDALRTHKNGPRADPMERLPNELITAIILEVSTSKKEWYAAKDIHVLVPFMVVSKRWHKFIMSEPLLWNNITLKNHIPFERISRQIELSSNLPLSLSFVPHLDQWKTICPELCKHRKRIQTIAFSNLRCLDPHLMKFLPALSPLPNLKQLGLGHVHRLILKTDVYDMKRVFKLFPSINELYNIPLSSEDLKIVKDKLVSAQVETYDSPIVFLPIAETMPDIRRVMFLEGTNDKGTKDDPAEQFYGSSQQLNWTHLTCDQHNSYTPVSFLHCLPYLTALTLRMNLSTLKNVISVAHRFPSLHFFEATVVLDPGDVLSPSFTSFPNLQVHTVQISILIPCHFNNPDDNRGTEHMIQECREIPEMILRAMPEANDLLISIESRGASIPFFALKGIFNGKQMIIDLGNCTIVPSTNMQLPCSVETLSVRCKWNTIGLLSSPSLKHLDIQSDFDFGSDSDSNSLHSPVEPQQIDLRAWPSLETIRIYKNWVQWDVHSLSSLRSVTIWTSEEEILSARRTDSVTCFVRDMACQPHSYPALEDLHFGRCPEWDILVIMLERRNLLSSSNIKPIKKLSIPSLLPHKVYQVIGNLLRCKWSDGPSNRELSISGNAKMILDPNV